MASAGGLKRSFMIDLDRSEHADFHGLRAIQLQSGALDPTKAREALAFALFREAGVPAPRTALAEVTLTVPGRYDKAYLGLVHARRARGSGVPEGSLPHRQGPAPAGRKGCAASTSSATTGRNTGARTGRWPSRRPDAGQAPHRRSPAWSSTATTSGSGRRSRSYLDVDEFLRFMAVQALIANADGFFTLGYNYSLFLDPRTNRFVFIPGDQELSFANFLMMGSADQLMDMSLAHPYGGENRLADRLLAIKDVRDAYRKSLKELASTIFRKDRLLADVAAIESATKAILEREAAARAERAEPPVGFGPPGWPGGPRPPDVRREAVASRSPISSPGKKDGYRPQFNFGPPGGGAPPKPIDDKTIGEVVKAPPGFRVTLFAAPPKVGYPVALSVAPDGAVYVAVDEQGSLGRTPGGGRVLRCVDDDGDGKADRVNVFAKMEHPRGVIAQDGKVWVLHPPFLSVFRDEDGDGVSDRQEVLVSGLTTSLIDERGGDHTTNGIRMGIDGWIYIAVGDYGFHGAKGKDGTTLSQRGRRHPPRPARRHGAGGLRHRPAQSVRHRDRPVPEPLHAGQHQRRGGLGRARQPPDPDRRLRLLAAVRQLPRRDHAAARGLRPGGRDGRAVPARRALARGVSRRAAHRRLGPERGLPARPEARRGHASARTRASS